MQQIMDNSQSKEKKLDHCTNTRPLRTSSVNGEISFFFLCSGQCLTSLKDIFTEKQKIKITCFLSTDTSMGSRGIGK